MTTPRAIVLDANILMRALLGRRVALLIQDFATRVTFLTPEVSFEDVSEHLGTVLTKRGEMHALPAAQDKLAALRGVIQVVDLSEYEAMKSAALARVGARDADDWPILACALLLNCPVWTEDRDFFGTGIATWTTALVELYFTDVKVERPDS